MLFSEMSIFPNCFFLKLKKIVEENIEDLQEYSNCQNENFKKLIIWQTSGEAAKILQYFSFRFNDCFVNNSPKFGNNF